MASVVRKLIIIISTTILLQPAIKGQYIIYNDNINENIDLPDLFEHNSNISKTLNSEENYLDNDLDLEELENFADGLQLRNVEKTKSTHFCMAVPKEKTEFGTNSIEYKPSVIQEYECNQFNRITYDSNINGGICLLPRKHCTTIMKHKTFLKREKEFKSGWWVSESKYIAVGCNCHNLNNGF